MADYDKVVNSVTTDLSEDTRQQQQLAEDVVPPLPHPRVQTAVNSTPATVVDGHWSSGNDEFGSSNFEHPDWFRYIAADIPDDDVMQLEPEVEETSLFPVLVDAHGEKYDTRNRHDVAGAGRTKDGDSVSPKRRVVHKRSKSPGLIDRSKSTKGSGNLAVSGGIHSSPRYTNVLMGMTHADDDISDDDGNDDVNGRNFQSFSSPCDKLQPQCSGEAKCVLDHAGDPGGPSSSPRCRCPLGTTGSLCERGQWLISAVASELGRQTSRVCWYILSRDMCI